MTPPALKDSEACTLHPGLRDTIDRVERKVDGVIATLHKVETSVQSHILLHQERERAEERQERHRINWTDILASLIKWGLVTLICFLGLLGVKHSGILAKLLGG